MVSYAGEKCSPRSFDGGNMCAKQCGEKKNTIFIFAIILINLEKERSYSMKWRDKVHHCVF